MIFKRIQQLPKTVVAAGFVATGVALLTAAPAQAQLKLPDLAQVDGGSSAGMPQAVVVQPRPIKFVVGVGFTGGGDRLATARYRSYDYWYGGYDYEDRSVRAGQLLQINAGVEWRVAPALTMQATIGYHTDSVNARNGDIDFTRYPLELLMHYQFAPQWRAGGGLRYTLNPRLDFSGVVNDPDVRFKRSIGPVVEVEYLPIRWLGIKLRGVIERYKPRDGGESANGNHFGLFANFYF